MFYINKCIKKTLTYICFTFNLVYNTPINAEKYKYLIKQAVEKPAVMEESEE